MSRIKLPTLLSITDNPSVRYWVKKHLEEDFFIIDASKAEVALETARSTSLDFIVVDSDLEDCDSLELCKELKQILRTLVPILLITGRLKKSYLDAALESGVTDFLNNQLDPDELQARIATIRKTHAVREKTQEASSALIQRNETSSSHLKNRVLLPSQAIKILEEGKQEGAPMTALILRIDQFNELKTLGALILEKILASLIKLLQSSLSKGDLLIPSSEGRLILLLKNSTLDQGRSLAEKIRKDVLAATFQVEEKSIRLTISVIISALSGSKTEFNRMIDSSFKALKTAKDLIIIDKETL